jgi:hypothetical protein
MLCAPVLIVVLRVDAPRMNVVSKVYFLAVKLTSKLLNVVNTR